MRYKNLLLFMLALAIVGGAVEALLRLVHAPISLTDGSGPGEVLVFVIVLPAILWFSQKIAGVNAFAFLGGYVRDGRRALRGFGLTFATAVIAMLAIHLILAYAGRLWWSHEAWNALTPQIWVRTITSLLVVLVLATTEEIIFRGFVLRYLRSDSSLAVTVAAVVASSVIFSLSHLIALRGFATTELLIGLFCLGMLLGVVYVVTGSLACSIGVHAGLLGFKVFLHRAQLVEYIGGGKSDLRISPDIWLALLATALVFIALRKWLRPSLWIETAVSKPVDAAGRIGFRTETGAS